MTDIIKHSGQVFTPDYLVTLILDEAGYRGKAVLRKHCIDNSCGDGAFLCEIARRYCTAYLEAHGNTGGLREELREFIHGIEIDPVAFECCKENLISVFSEFDIADCPVDIINGDTLAVDKYDGKMDFVVGNPPYVRVHNLEDNFASVKAFSFANGGMTDLYLVFFEIGFNMLKKGGRLCYITPSSWINSVAGFNMRQYILMNRNLISVIDLGHYQPFRATTYTMISLFEKGLSNKSFEYDIFDASTLSKVFVDTVPFEKVCINGYFYLADSDTLSDLTAILCSPCKKYVSVKNGFATLADSVFISPGFPFDEYTIPVIKASTGKWYEAFFPYDSDGKPLSYDAIFGNREISQYLMANREALLKGRTEDEQPLWYLYGRTQALKDVSADKIAINTCIKDVKSIKLNRAEAGQGVYSGLYILTEVPFSVISQIIVSDAFIKYISSLKKYKSGGYYTFNSKELEIYLNYKIQQLIDNGDFHLSNTYQRRVPQGNLALF